MQQLIAKMEMSSRKQTLPEFRVGDIVRVHQRIREGGKERIQVFEGVVIARKHGTGMSGTFTVRRIASGVGVERIFPLHSPAIVKIERTHSSKVRRAKLYFLRGLSGKKAKLKGWEAYASWSESAEPEPEAKDSSLDESVESADRVSENPEASASVATDSQGHSGESSKDDLGAQTNRESGGAAGRRDALPEGAPHSPEKSQD